MFQRRSATLAVACSLAFAAISPVFAKADDNTTFRTAAADSEASQAADAPEVTLASTSVSSTSTRRYYRKSRKSSASRKSAVRQLPSRGVSGGTAANVVGRLAMVQLDSAQIHAAGRFGRLLSVCPRGQYLNVSCETETQYGVLMIDRSLGYINKADVQLLDYQVVNTAPAQSGGEAAPGSLGQRLVQRSQDFLGVPYVWGGNTKNGIDCSGFVKAIYDTYGINLPRHSGDQAAVGYDVPRADVSQWVAGDRMYFACHHPEIDHTGMYIGGGYFIHASVGHNRSVAIDRVDNRYYASHLVAVRRSKELLGETPSPYTAQTANNTTTSDAEADQE
ncbi:MAG: C40 family peptidase [Capsulimonas sp.]|uniref:C40 family peptidase n=1 Tax=Capsulimonas sp. TaxID=2494211 RepID=UPI003267A2B4